jgi:hypothetical protein
MADGTARGGAEYRVVPGHMPGHPADGSTRQAPGLRRRGNESGGYRQHTGGGGEDRLHVMLHDQGPPNIGDAVRPFDANNAS